MCLDCKDKASEKAIEEYLHSQTILAVGQEDLPEATQQPGSEPILNN